MPSHQVEITVRDKSSGRTGVYRCDARLLKTSMRYFAPSISQQEATLEKSESSDPGECTITTAPSHSPPITLKASCELPIFEWLLQWIHYHDEALRNGTAARTAPGAAQAPEMTCANVVSLLLASSFLQMQELSDEALWFMRRRFAEIVDSDVDLDCLPGELLARLSSVVRPTDAACALLRLEQQQHRTHPNRRFVVSLLSHFAEDYCHPQCDRGTPATTTTTNHLRWCRLCHALVDVAALDRARRDAPADALPPLCPALAPTPTASSALPKSGVTTATTHTTTKAPPPFAVAPVMMGPRGELFDSHVASEVVPAPLLRVPPLSAGATRAVELWCWRVLGSARCVQCRHCRHLLSLIDAPTHRALCPATPSPAPYATSDFIPMDEDDADHRPTSATTTGDSACAGESAECSRSQEDSRAVLNWFFHAETHGVYAEAEVLRASPPTRTEDAVEVPNPASVSPAASPHSADIVPARSTDSAARLTPLTCTNTDDLAAMHAECIALPDVPVPMQVGSPTSSNRPRRPSSTSAPSASRPRSSTATCGDGGEDLLTTTSHHEETKLRRAMNEHRLTATRADMSRRLQESYGVASPLLLAWRQLPPAVVSEVVPGAGAADGAVNSDVQTFMERQMMWDMDEWTTRVAVRRTPAVRLSLTTALPVKSATLDTGSSPASPLSPSMEMSPRPIARTRSTANTQANSSGRYALPRPEPTRRATAPTSETTPSARRGDVPNGCVDSKAHSKGRPKLSTRMSNPYAAAKPPPSSGNRRGTGSAVK